MNNNKLIILVSGFAVILFLSCVVLFMKNTIRPELNATINPEMVEVKMDNEGVLRDLYVAPKQNVEQGQLIAEIEVKDKAKTPQVVAKPDVSTAKAKLNEAEENYKNSALMYKDGVISQEEYDKSLNNLTSAQSAYKNAVLKAKNVAQVQTKNDSVIKKVYAPGDGIVNTNYISKGAEVKPNEPLFLLALNTPKVTAYIDEKTAKSIKPGQEVKIKVQTSKTRTFDGVIESVSEQPRYIQSLNTRAYPVYIGFKGNVEDYAFKPSQPVSVIFKK